MDMTSAYETVLDLWSGMTGGTWHHLEDGVVLCTPEMDTIYNDTKSAVLDCLYTINELVKEN